MSEEYQDEEVVIGVHESGIFLEEGMVTGGRNYCANCKRNIHCHVKVDKETRDAEIIMTCKNNDCECKCRTHYACKKCGHLHPYGMECNKKDEEGKIDSKADEDFENLMETWRKSQEVEEKPKKK